MQTFKEKHYATFNSYKITPITSNSIRGNDYIGPMIIDMYLPALPEAQHQFRSSTSEIQLTLSFAMIGLALGQFLFGPLSDAFGRKRMGLIILCIFFLATLSGVFAIT